MQELVMYYSYSGNTKHAAEVFALEYGWELCEIREKKRYNKLQAYTAGCFKAMKGAQVPIEEPAVNLGEYTAVHVFAPIWAGSIAPAMNSALALLAQGTQVNLHMVSGGGTSNQDKIIERLEAMGLELAEYEDIRA